MFFRERVRENWIRAGAVLLMAASLGYAYSGACVFLGNEFLKRGNPEAAFTSFRKADFYLSRKAAVYEGASLSTRKLALKNTAFAAEAMIYLKKWVSLPSSGSKARVYLAEAKINQLEKGKIAFENWKEIGSLLKEAVSGDPANAWVYYKSGSLAMVFKEFWTEEESRSVIQWLSKAARIRYRNPEWRYIEDPSPYLDPILNLLLQHGYSYENMYALVPSDYLSQREWMEFLEKHHLWKFRQLSYAGYQQTAEAYYDSQCVRGEDFFRAGKFLRAYYAFRKAFWSRDWAHVRAKAGILASEYRLGKLPDGKHELMKENISVLLRQIMEETDYPPSRDLLEALKPLTLLKGEAVGKKNGSPELFKRGYDASLWWGSALNKPLAPGAQMNYPLFLNKGINKGTVQIRLKLSQSGAFAVLKARVNQREVGEFLVDNKETGAGYPFVYTSSGGERWLQLEVMHFSPPDAELEFGTVQLKPEEKRI